MDRPMTWTELEARLSRGLGPLGWHQEGAEWRGPCPVTLRGSDCAWAGGGPHGEVRLGCRHCVAGGRLQESDFREHVAAITGEAFKPIGHRPWKNYGSTRELVERAKRTPRGPTRSGV